jgi:ABC-type branched-subunit amino acid transport system ATPase component
MLEVQAIHSGYGNIAVLSDISFALEAGAILGVLGRNGMGKSTLIRTIAGTLGARSGFIKLNGDDITALPAHLRADRGITTVVQGRGIFPKPTVWENLEMGPLDNAIRRALRWHYANVSNPDRSYVGRNQQKQRPQYFDRRAEHAACIQSYQPLHHS